MNTPNIRIVLIPDFIVKCDYTTPHLSHRTGHKKLYQRSFLEAKRIVSFTSDYYEITIDILWTVNVESLVVFVILSYEPFDTVWRKMFMTNYLSEGVVMWSSHFCHLLRCTVCVISINITIKILWDFISDIATLDTGGNSNITFMLACQDRLRIALTGLPKFYWISALHGASELRNLTEKTPSQSAISRLCIWKTGYQMISSIDAYGSKVQVLYEVTEVKRWFNY